MQGQGSGPARGAVHINVNEMAFGGARLARVSCKDADFIAHAGRADTRDTNARHHRFRKSQRRKIMALGFNHQANHAACVNVNGTVLYQQAVDGSVKPAVINNIVDVALHIIVRPAGVDGSKSFVGASRLGMGPRKG